jgi:hypothetical protein
MMTATILCSLRLLAPWGAATAEPAHLLALPLGSDHWTFSAQGPYQACLDMRELYQINHPFVVSGAGSFGQLSGEVSVPATWRGPIKLRFYQGKSCQANPDRTKNGGYDTSFVGHRFRQLLIDGRVVWEADVADPGPGSHHVVDLSEWLKPGQSAQLAMRIYDKVGTDVELEQDFIDIGTWIGEENHRRFSDPSITHRFEIRSYWGDLALYDGSVTDEAAAQATQWDWLKDAQPLNIAAAAIHGTAATGPIKLRLEASPGSALPESGYPVRTGVPFAQGMLPPGSIVALRDPSGSDAPVQTEVLTRWQDGSAKWVLLDFIAYPRFA